MRSVISQLMHSRVFLSAALGVVVLSVGVAIFMMANAEPEVAETTSTTSTTTTTTTTSPTTTTQPTTTITAGTTSQLNGLPVADPSLLNRRLLAVKIDNHPNARPHSGIEKSDAVIELMVEGVTRFISMWQQSDSEYLGPMRSGRPTDQTLLAAFNEPTFVISGGQSWVQDMIRSVGIHLIGEVRPATFRTDRPGPHDLYTNTVLLRQHADSLGYPNLPIEGPMWEFGPMRPEAAPVSSIELDFLGNPVEWTWDAASGTWLRTLGGRESNWVLEDDTEGPIGFPVLVLLYVEQYVLGGLPSSYTAGSGRAFVFADGKVVDGSWQRDEITEWFTLTDGNGQTIQVPPGQVWISLVPNTTALSME
jgi:hypothetical protein